MNKEEQMQYYLKNKYLFDVVHKVFEKINDFDFSDDAK